MAAIFGIDFHNAPIDVVCAPKPGFNVLWRALAIHSFGVANGQSRRLRARLTLQMLPHLSLNQLPLGFRRPDFGFADDWPQSALDREHPQIRHFP